MTEDTLSLALTLREVTGKKVRVLRANGTVPAVIHDHGKPSINVEAPYLAIYRTYLHAGKHHPVQLTAGDKKFTALIKSATFEPKKNMLTHVVFNAVNRNQKVEAEVPIHPRYAEGEESTPAERKSMVVLEQLASIEVRAVPDKIPDALYYHAEKLVEDGDSVAVRDLMIPDGVEIDEEMLDHPVATVTTTAALDAANAAMAGPEEEEKAEAETTEGAETSELAEGGENSAKKEE